MSELERVIRVVNWLILEQKVESRRDLAEKLGYTESSMSQILNGKVKLSGRFIKKLSDYHPYINEEWVRDGVGNMLYNSDILSEPEVRYEKKEQLIPIEIYKLSLENERLNKEKELELMKQNSELIELLKKAYEK
jgi:transcriptional regulator with XRE-family HTH domain